MKKSASRAKTAGKAGSGASKGNKDTRGDILRGSGGDPKHGSRSEPIRDSKDTIHNGSAGAFDATEHSHDEDDFPADP